MIELKNVSKYYNNNGIVTLGLRNINLSFAKGEIVAIVGESGSGKSTLLNVICGVDTYEEGEIFFKGNETSYFNQNDMDIFRKRNVSFIYQSYNIIDSYTVLENVMLPLLIQGYDKKEAKKKALELIEKVGLSKRVKHRGIKLSGGEKQRCVIARALASDSEILACDEPTGNLDSQTGKEIIDLIKELAQDKLVLIVTHNYEQIKDIVTRTIKISDGEVIEDYKTKDITDDIKEEMDLSLDKVKRKSLLSIATYNILRTPKKNVLSLAVFFVFSLIGLFLYLFCVAQSDESMYNSYDGFKNMLHNRIIVFNEDHTPLDMSKLKDIKGTKYENAFYEDEVVYTRMGNGYATHATISNYMPKNIYKVIGEAPKNENEVFMVLSSDSANYYYHPYKNGYEAGELITFENMYNYNGFYGIKSLKLTGVAICDELSENLCVTNRAYNGMVNCKEIKKGYAVIDGEEIEISVGTAKQETYLYYYGPTQPEIKEITLLLKNLYPITIPITEDRIIYEESDEVSIEYIFLENEKMEVDDTYELTIYADNINSAINKIKSLGYSYYQPAKSGYNKMSLNFILLVVFVFFSTLALFVLTFVSYVILARVYASKNKDFTILRSLGLVKKQMAKIVNYEVLFMGLISSVLAVLTLYLISLFNKTIAKLLGYNSLGFMLFYFVLMLIFSYFIARRFNRRLFKFTVGTSIKGEVVRND